MKQYKQLKLKLKQKLSFYLSILLTLMAILPYLPVLEAKAATGDQVVLTTAHGAFGGSHKLYCIDKGGLAIWGIADDGDVYECHRPSELCLALSVREQEYVFWGILTLQASLGVKEANDVIAAIRLNAQAQGRMSITNLVTEEDLKALIYSSGVRAKYPWLETVASHTEEYLKLGGLTGEKGSTASGKKIPDVLAEHTALTTAYQVNRSDLTIHFDENGADADFISKVPLLFSNDNGASFHPEPTDGWTYTKTTNSITFSNPNPEPPKALIRFAVEGTEYASAKGAYSSKEALFDECLQIWECVRCSGTHTGGTPPTSETWFHQRMVWLEIKPEKTQFFAALAGEPTVLSEGVSITFRVFRHAEDFSSTYNVRLYKYDHETGKPLEGARFVLYERFDDRDQIDTERDGPVHLYVGGEPYAGGHTDREPVWDGFRNAASLITDTDGYASKSLEHGYHYDKTFCDGHPAPVFAAVPEPEEDEETGEILNGEAIEAARALNRKVANAWLDCEADCGEQAEGDFEGVHFHWVMEDVNAEEIKELASTGGQEGETPDGGNTSEPDEETAYESSGCYQDMLESYDRFISLKYSYAFTEFQAREGYIRHDVHAEDLPIEIITTDSSENGANAFFSGEYSRKETLESNGMSYGAEKHKLKEPDAEISSHILPFVRAEYERTDSLFSFEFLDEDESEEQTEKRRDSVLDPEAIPANAETAPSNAEAAPSNPEATPSNAEATPSAPEAAPSNAEAAPSAPEATPSDAEAGPSDDRATPSEAENVLSELSFSWFSFRVPFRSPGSGEEEEEDTGERLFPPAYEEALGSESVGAEVQPGPHGNYSHCGDRDGEGDAWRIYDHRTEGEFHINKKDLDLAAGESEDYASYADTQGDGTLSGAVYGLFAAEDIIHPDGKTGVVYKANNLVAVAATDQNGDASFLVNTEGPGHTYDYSLGSIAETKDGWAKNAPSNLYLADRDYDDYTEDGQYVRTYFNYEEKNGNCWIGRPLLLGRYYVKELSRSEGYELSIGNRQHPFTNFGQDTEAKAPDTGEGYAGISRALFADEQTAEDGEGAGPNELFFSSESRDTKGQRYDIVLSGLPAGVSVYRKEAGTKKQEVSVGTGVYERILLTNPDGTPKYVTADHDYQYPKYHPDGSLMNQEVPIHYRANQFRQVSVRRLKEELIQEILERADGNMTPAQNQEVLSSDFTEGRLAFVKGKAEAALRRNGKSTPRGRSSGGGWDYSGIYAGVFDCGVREGERDPYGISGVAPGSPAACTVYGSPVQRVEVPKRNADGTALTVGDAILAVLGYYDRNPYWSYGGIDDVEESGGSYIFTLYAGVSGNPENFMVLGSDPEEDSIIFHAVRDLPEDPAQPPRLLYASYSNNPAYDAFGTYEAYRGWSDGSSVLGSALLVPDAVADEMGKPQPKTTPENVYYAAGEEVRDREGNRIQAFEYREIMTTQSQDIEEVRWKRIPAVRKEDGTYVISVDTAYTDEFGAAHSDVGATLSIEWKAVLKEKEATLSAEDAAYLGAGFTAGSTMDSASYYVHAKKARARAYLDYLNTGLAGENTYLIPAELVYPGQEDIYQDAKTRQLPGQVYERIIRQKIKIIKDIETTPEGTYVHNTNAETGHRDRFTSGPGGTKDAASLLSNFRFKAYLKSNLERLYRDENGTVVWLDQDGTEVSVKDFKENYPKQEPYAQVQKLYTKVPHRSDSVSVGSLSNNVGEEAIIANKALYSFEQNGWIREEANPGYTRLLETVSRVMEDGAGKTRIAEEYHYEKFFDAIRTANHDKWDQNKPMSTFFKPFSRILERIFGTEGGEREYPAAHNNEAIQNRSNTSDEALSNQKASDAVRQFAVTWYLDEEVKRLTEKNAAGDLQPKGGSAAYQEEIYDKALYQALRKAENYLKPFFAYDLDEIYAVEWDSEADGGRDRDKTTLSADICCEVSGSGKENPESGCFYGISKYLPYGIYVAVEQQPYSAGLGDFYNKHYKTDRPKEITVPSLYEAGGNADSLERFDSFYEYSSKKSPEQLAADYQIRMNEEWAENHMDPLRCYVIHANNQDGAFEVYKYGLDADKRIGAGSVSEESMLYQGFSFTQEEYFPYKSVYKSENPGSAYHSNEKVEAYYHYASISEQAGLADDVLYQHGDASDENNPSGFYFRDRVQSITGALTGYEGRYFAALAPWAVAEPPGSSGSETYDSSACTGYADGKYRNTFYTSKLRIEKLDSETGENILHDGAIFTLYSAEREDGEHTDGRVKFYESDTVITGSREFLEAMGASGITPVARAALPWELPFHGRYYGTVPAGTPICREQEQVVLEDAFGNQTGRFQAFTTIRDGSLGEGTIGGQNVGYLETLQPLGAGCYVLCEVKAPAGYVRSRPMAIEIYSDEAAYYLEGRQDKRVLAAVYEDPILRTADNEKEIVNPDGTKPNGNKPQDLGATARVYVNNTPIRLEVTKAKPDETEASFELDGRLEGSITQLEGRYGLENLELACNASGTYLGYGWKKGFLDALRKKQAAGEDIEILYADGIFTGRAVLKKALETADDTNRYLPGARMTLYDAIEVKQSGDQEDYRFTGVKIERDSFGNVRRMYVQKGYAGTAIKYVLDKSEPLGTDPEDFKRYTYADQEDDRGEGTWLYKTVEREDTDILFYDLGDLSVLEEVGGVLYGYDRDKNRVRAENGRSLFALKNGVAAFEIICPDYENLTYSKKDRGFVKVPEGTEFYHLDGDKNRDSRVIPDTGMAYVVEEDTGKILVWPVQVSKDEYGNVIAREKIKTGRLASVSSDTEEEYTIGTYQNGILEKIMNPVLNIHGQPEYYPRSSERYRKGRPIYDRDGDYVRYGYDDKLKGYNSNAWRIDTSKELSDIGADPESEEDDRPLYHRYGEGYVMENTWITGEEAPNDPFRSDMTRGQVDVLKRIPAGLYILEETEAPQGYVKTMPIGVTVEEDREIQTVKAVDWPIGAYFEKLDAPDKYERKVLDREGLLEEEEIRLEGKGGYSFQSVKGTELALFRARRVLSDQLSSHPFGYYLEKAENTPAQWSVSDGENRPQSFTARWTVGDRPKYLEAIPKGDYILEEVKTLPGYIPASKWVQIEETAGLQYVSLPNDHTKLEILKYEEEEGKKRPLSAASGAVLSLYEAETDENGIIMKDGIPQYKADRRIDTWTADDCREYTEVIDLSRYGKKGGSALLERLLRLGKGEQTEQKSGFIHNFSSLYEEYGPSFQEISWKVEKTAVRISENPEIFVMDGGKRIVKEKGTFVFDAEISSGDREGFEEQYQISPDADEICWPAKRSARRVHSEESPQAESVRQLWETEDGKQILIQISRGMTQEGTYGYIYDYKFHYQRLSIPGSPDAVSYDTMQGRHRIDYLACETHGLKNGNRAGFYVLVEEQTPSGYEQAPPKAIVVEETEEIQLYGLENRKKGIELLKTDEEGRGLAGAVLLLYRADPEGGLIESAEALKASWISGEDGFYTKEEEEAGKIPEGLSAGALRPHRIEGLEDGLYYLVEEKAPEGYCRLDPQRIWVSDDALQSQMPLMIPNRRKKGVVELFKADEENPQEKLEGAVFELKNLDTGEILQMVTDENGFARSGEVETGRNVEGVWKPWRFSVKELIPPERYALNFTETVFTFSDDGWSGSLFYRLNVTDEQTRIEISKTDFKTGHMVKGAVLAIYETEERDGSYTAVGSPVEKWSSDGESHMVKGVLSAGEVYLLKELEAPEGYALTKPVLFSISDDGRRISGVSGDMGMLRFYTSPDFPDAIEKLTVWGRKAAGTRRVITDTESGESFELAYGEGICVNAENAPTDLSSGPALKEGRLYEEKELTLYTDGASRLSAHRIFRMKRDEDGMYLPDWRLPVETRLAIEEEDGARVEAWSVENHPESGYQKTIYNPAYEEKRGIAVSGANGRGGAAVSPGSVIRYEVIYKNTEKSRKDSKLSVYLDEQLEWMPANSSPEWEAEPGDADEKNTIEKNGSDGRNHFAVKNRVVAAKLDSVEPGEERRLILTAAVGPDAKKEVRCAAKMDGEKYEAVNPIGGSGCLTLVNRVTGTAVKTVTGSFSYRIRLTSPFGEPLKGAVPYSGSKTGVLRSGDTISLSAGEAVTLSGLPWGTAYQIEETQKTRQEAEASFPFRSVLGAEGMTGVIPVSALFLYEKRDESMRDVFQKNKRYTLLEHTRYSDGEILLSGRRFFGLNKEAAPVWFDIADAPIEIFIGKMDRESGKSVLGAEMQLFGEDGALLEEWVSDGTPHPVQTVLSPGERILLHENEAPPGYGLAEDMEFVVPEEGGIFTVEMEDQPIHVTVRKVEKAAAGEERGEEAEPSDLAGASLAICHPDGTVAEQWISDGRPHRVEAPLLAGGRYYLEEKEPPEGYVKAAPLYFTVPKEGGGIILELVNKQTRITIRKLALESDGKTRIGPLKGAVIRIEEEDGTEVCRFTTDESGSQTLTGILTAGSSYRAVEVAPPPGYKRADPVSFTVPTGEESITILIYDIKQETPAPGPGKDHPDKPGRPQIPKKQEVPVEGTLTVHFDEAFTGRGRIRLGNERLIPLPGTGEGAGRDGVNHSGPLPRAWPGACAALLLFLSAAFFGIKELKKGKAARAGGKGERNKRIKECGKKASDEKRSV